MYENGVASLAGMESKAAQTRVKESLHRFWVRQLSYKPSSVRDSRESPSVIYLSPQLPAGVIVLPSGVTKFRADNPQTPVYANFQRLDCTARTSPCARWALTPPSHPYHPCGWRLFSSTVCLPSRITSVSEGDCPVLPGLSSCGFLISAGDRPDDCRYCFRNAKLLQINEISGFDRPISRHRCGIPSERQQKSASPEGHAL